MNAALQSNLTSCRISVAAGTFLAGLALTGSLRAGLDTGDTGVACCACLGAFPTELACTAGIKAVSSDSCTAFV